MEIVGSNMDIAVNTPTTEWEMGVTPLNNMTDRQIAEETLYWLRETGKALAEIQKQGVGGMLKAMMGR